jgi:hypothetical protein
MVRHPDAPGFDKAKAVVTDLLFSIKDRGRHATGIAAIGDKRAKVSKWAVDPGRMIPSDTWRDTMATFSPSVRVLIGHVRHATFNNATSDAAAHPYAIGRTVGAHNGIVRNWQEFVPKSKRASDFLTDSHAVLDAIERSKDKPEGVLGRIKGDYALTWAREGRLWIARNAERPLACAYVPGARTLFWCSEMEKLVHVLEAKHKLESSEYEVWTPKVGTIYALDPMTFDAEGSNPERRDVEVPKGERAYTTAQTEFGDGNDYGWTKGQGWGPISRKSERERVAAALDKIDGERYAARKKPRAGRGSAAELTLSAMNARLDELEATVARLEEENDFLLTQLSELSGDRESFRRAVEEEDDDDADACVVCGQDGNLIRVEDGPIHEACIFGATA